MKKCGNLAEYPGKKWFSNTPVDEVQSPESETLHHGEPSSWSELKYRAMWQWRTLATHSQKDSRTLGLDIRIILKLKH